MAPRTKPGATNARTAKTSDSPAAKPQQPAAQAPAQPAQVKPASDPTPAGANTLGKVLPETAPAPKSTLQKIKDSLVADWQEARRQKEANNAGKTQAQINRESMAELIDMAPIGGRGLSGGLGRGLKGGAKPNAPRNTTASPAPAPASKPTATPAPPPAPLPANAGKAADATPNAANGKDGGRSNGKTKRKPTRRCELVPHGELQCEKGQQAHHVVPDWMLRTGKRDVEGQQIPGMPNLDDAPAICLETGKGKPHNVAHKHTDKVAQRVGREGRATGTPGTIQVGQAKKISARGIEKGTGGPAKGGCSRKDIEDQLNKYFKAPEDAKVRAVYDARRVTDAIRNAVTGPQGEGM